METSSTSSSERHVHAVVPVWRSKAVAIVVLALVMVVGTDRLVAWQRDDTVAANFADRLFVQPRADGVYLLGNSMFKTGVDPEQLARDMGGVAPVDLEYHDGHYTSLWYLIAKTALGKTAEDPRVVVWGFRPHFAMDPAFRQNTLNETDLFAFEDELYDGLTTGVDFNDPPTLSSANVRARLAESSGLYAGREDLKSRMNESALEAGVDLLDAVGVEFAERFRRAVIDGDRSLADEITRLVTDGEVVLTEELVVDSTGDFITGPPRPFAAGFLPATAEAIRDAGLEQLVIIWRPIIAAEGNPDPDEDRFVADAIAWFEDNAIPYLDLYHDERIRPEHYGSGDHYNAEGRRLITSIVAERVAGQFYGDDTGS